MDRENGMFLIDRERDTHFYIVGWCALLLGVAACGVVVLTGFDLIGLLGPCVLYMLTGLYCPGCGGTRAVRALLAGDLVRSFVCHPVVPFAAILGGWFMVSQTIERISRGRIGIGMHVRDVHLWGALGIIVVNFLIKNAVLMIWGIDLLA